MGKVKNFIPPKPLETAVLFLVFNRLETTKQVFEQIKKAQPPRLYIAADGARKSKEGEEHKVKQVREYLLSNIGWECEVKTLFRDENLGCGHAVSGAITWFFENEKMGIILEDDCLPSQSFFWFCEDLLEKYQDNKDVFLISGDGRATSAISIEEDYTCIKYPLIWGWASWSRVWKKYNLKMDDWKFEKQNILSNVSLNRNTKRYWADIFEKMYYGKIDTWDYQLCYLLLKNKAKCIVPKKNLVSNIGFGQNATHTFDKNSKNANIESFELEFPLKNNQTLSINNKLNDFYDKTEFSQINIFTRIINKVSRIILGKNIIS